MKFLTLWSASLLLGGLACGPNSGPQVDTTKYDYQWGNYLCWLTVGTGCADGYHSVHYLLADDSTEQNIEQSCLGSECVGWDDTATRTCCVNSDSDAARNPRSAHIDSSGNLVGIPCK